tara:strand:- start:1413 stop:2882 length:1470 start_codon:yes stop_codon:yes gene_type:complete
MGFRGEALSSIASVSDFSISSNKNNNTEGYEIRILSGRVKYVKPANQKKGSCVKVRNLFFSTPARLKFLKSDNYESTLIKRLIQNFALVHFDKEFNLYTNNKILIKTSISKEKEVKKRFFNRVNQILGKDFIDNSIDLDATTENLSLSGLLGYPTFNYSNSNNQFVFVNGRVINDKTINTIFRVAYRDVMFHDRFPQLILNIRCPLDWVDVNVHPMKNEVRFSDFNFLKSFIIKTFRNSFENLGYKNNKLTSSTPLVEQNHKNSFQEKIKLKETNYSNYDKVNGYDSFKEPNSLKESYPLGHAKIQFHRNYIISETEEGIIIVDQHAAHERIVYESLKKDYYANKIKTQLLLIPIVLNLDNLLIKDSEKKFENLEMFGLKIDAFGTNSVIVREIPALVSDCNVKNLVDAVLNEITNDNSFESLETEVNRICSTIACHGSIRSGRKLEIEEMNDLLRKMENTKLSGQCNHGRPTFIKFNIAEIEKLFGRK